MHIRGDDSDIEMSDDENEKEFKPQKLNMEQYLKQLRHDFENEIDDDTAMSKIQLQIILRGINTTLDDQYLESIIDKLEGKNGQVNF